MIIILFQMINYESADDDSDRSSQNGLYTEFPSATVKGSQSRKRNRSPMLSSHSSVRANNGLSMKLCTSSPTLPATKSSESSMLLSPDLHNLCQLAVKASELSHVMEASSGAFSKQEISLGVAGKMPLVGRAPLSSAVGAGAEMSFMVRGEVGDERAKTKDIVVSLLDASPVQLKKTHSVMSSDSLVRGGRDVVQGTSCFQRDPKPAHEVLTTDRSDVVDLSLKRFKLDGSLSGDGLTKRLLPRSAQDGEQDSLTATDLSTGGQKSAAKVPGLNSSSDLSSPPIQDVHLPLDLSFSLRAQGPESAATNHQQSKQDDEPFEMEVEEAEDAEERMVDEEEEEEEPIMETQILLLNGKEYEIVPVGEGRWITKNEYELLQGLSSCGLSKRDCSSGLLKTPQPDKAARHECTEGGSVMATRVYCVDDGTGGAVRSSLGGTTGDEVSSTIDISSLMSLPGSASVGTGDLDPAPTNLERLKAEGDDASMTDDSPALQIVLDSESFDVTSQTLDVGFIEEQAGENGPKIKVTPCSAPTSKPQELETSDVDVSCKYPVNGKEHCELSDSKGMPTACDTETANFHLDPDHSVVVQENSGKEDIAKTFQEPEALTT